MGKILHTKLKMEVLGCSSYIVKWSVVSSSQISQVCTESDLFCSLDCSLESVGYVSPLVFGSGYSVTLCSLCVRWFSSILDVNSESHWSHRSVFNAAVLPSWIQGSLTVDLVLSFPSFFLFRKFSNLSLDLLAWDDVFLVFLVASGLPESWEIVRVAKMLLPRFLNRLY